MLCQACQAAEATYRVTERVAPDGFVESRYCEGCCKATAGLPDSAPPGLYTLIDRETGRNRVVTLEELIAICSPR